MSQVDIKRTKGGKPFCTNSGSRASAPNFNFNVSHEVGQRGLKHNMYPTK